MEAQATAAPTAVSQELVATTCETVIQSALPAFTRALLEGLAAQFDKMRRDSAAAQAAWQKTAENVDATLQEIRASTGRPMVNVNCSARNKADLDRINLEAATPDEAANIRATALPITHFLRQQWKPDWAAVLPYQRFSSTFAILLWSRKLKALGAQPPTYAGQIGRAQAYYSEADRPLMRACFEEDALPIVVERLRHKGVLVGAGGARAIQAAATPPPKKCIQDYFAKAP